MPNGTYGGVRGEAGDGFTYSIQLAPAQQHQLFQMTLDLL